MPCSGNCCARFYIDWKPENFAVSDPTPGSEAAYIKDMLIYLEDYKDETGNTNYKGAWYTCKHWDRETKLCKQYEKRPSMCSDFPYGRKCQYDDKCDVAGNVRTKCEDPK